MATDSEISAIARRMRAAELLHSRLLDERRPWHEVYAASRAADSERARLRATIDAENQAPHTIRAPPIPAQSA